MQEPDPITVFISSRESTCDECGHETQYDSLLAKGEERYEARRIVQEAIEDILRSWS